MTLHQPGRLHLQHEVWPAPVRPRAQQLEQTLPLHPEEDAPVEVLVPLARRHLRETSLQGLLLHRLVIAHEGRAVFGVLDANKLRASGGLDGKSLLVLDLEPVEERARTQKPMPLDTLPAPVLRHVVERRVSGDQALGFQTPPLSRRPAPSPVWVPFEWRLCSEVLAAA